MTRKYFIEEKEKEYVVFAYSKGLTTSSIFFKHIFRNTCVVILRTLPIDLGLAIFGFSVITETQ
jgi:ABC-type dipeptide/oligopeptide/nickel transport system permease component